MNRGIVWGLAVFTLVILLGTPANAFKNEPVSFRGVEWGAKLDGLEGFKVISEEGDFISCIRKDENSKFGKADLDFIEYKFFKGRFFRAELNYSELWNYDELKARLFHVFGPVPEKKDDHRHWRWVGSDVTIDLNYLIFSRSGMVAFTYWPIVKEHEELERVLGREGSPDF